MRSNRIKSVSNLKLQPPTLEKTLPSLQSSTLATKTLFTLAKVDIDCKQPIRHTLSEMEQRSQSGLAIRKNKQVANDQKMMMAKTILEARGPVSFKFAVRQTKEEEPPVSSQVSIEKAKISTKTYGIVKAYSANSHPGPMLSYNEDRICIITNLTKTNIKQKQASFFGVYDGQQGVAKADYLRDNFHLLLVEDEAFSKNMESALRNTLTKLNKNFAADPKYLGDQSSVSFVILVASSKSNPIKDDEVHLLQCGSCKSIFSANLGQRIFFPSNSETQLLTRESSRKSRSVGELLRKNKSWKQTIQVEYKRFSPANELDFVVLGSEGLFQNIKIRDLGRRCWLYLLKNKTESIHFAVGQTNNNLLQDVFSSLGSKNTSIIIIALDGVEKCMEGSQKESFLLPYSSQTSSN